MLLWRNALLDLCRHELLFLTYGEPLISFGAPMLTQRTVQCHDAASGSFHMPLFTWRRAPYRKFWVSCQNVGDVFSRFDLPSGCDFIVGWCWTLFYATASGSYRSFHSSMKFLRQVQVQMLDQRVADPSECCKDTSINANIVFASVPCPFSRLRSCCQLLKTKMVVDNWTSGRSLHCLAWRSNDDQAGCSDSSWMLHNRYKGFKSPRYPVSEHTSGKV